MKPLILLPLLSLFVLPAVYADGGSGSNSTTYCNITSSCPTGQTGTIAVSFRVMGAGNKRTCENLAPQIQDRINAGWSYGDLEYWVQKQTHYGNMTMSDSCVSAIPTYQSTEKETQNLPCPSAQPSGVWAQSRTYDLWSDDSKKNISPWTDVTKTCTAIRQSNQTESRTVSCAIGEIGSVKETQTYEVWTDGSIKNYSGWVVSSKNCKAVPTKITETKDGVQEETCDSYYGVAQGTYAGTAYKYGTYTTTYSAATKTTDTKFEIKTEDFAACVAQITDIIQETDELACPPGQSGNIQRYRIRAQDSTGKTSYPYGKGWIISNNNCASMQTDTEVSTNTSVTPNGLLSNISVTSSSLQNGEAFSKYLNSLSASNWATNERHKLIVNIDDLSSGKYSASKVGAVISKFQSVVGAGNSDIEIALPMTIDKYIGNGEITAKAVKEKTLMVKGVTYEEGNARLSYVQLGKKATENPKSKEILINIIPKHLGLKGVFSN